MKKITNYFVEEYGLNLPDACIEVTNVNIAKRDQYSDGDPESPRLRNTIVDYSIWVNEAAYDTNKSPIATSRKIISLGTEDKNEVFELITDILFPEPQIEE
jgi:hypothetical protein